LFTLLARSSPIDKHLVDAQNLLRSALCSLSAWQEALDLAKHTVWLLRAVKVVRRIQAVYERRLSVLLPSAEPCALAVSEDLLRDLDALMTLFCEWLSRLTALSQVGVVCVRLARSTVRS
jgi:hypothetical protein